MIVLPGPASKKLGEKISDLLNVKKVEVDFKFFPDGESYICLKGDVLSEEVIIVQTTGPPQDTRIFQLVLMVDAVKRCGAKKVTVITPYLAYSRQDKCFLKGEALSIEAIAKIFKAVGINRLITVNIHEEQVLSKFPFPTKNVSAVPLLAYYFKKKNFKKSFLLAPDKGAMHIIEEAKKVLNMECGYLDKYRDRYTGEIRMEKKRVNVKGRVVIIFDDIISTGGTMIKAAALVKELGAKKVYAACVHPLLIGNAEELLYESGIEKIVGTDSIPSNVSKISLAPLLSKELYS